MKKITLILLLFSFFFSSLNADAKMKVTLLPSAQMINVGFSSSSNILEIVDIKTLELSVVEENLFSDSNLRQDGKLYGKGTVYLYWNIETDTEVTLYVSKDSIFSSLDSEYSARSKNVLRDEYIVIMDNTEQSIKESSSRLDNSKGYVVYSKESSDKICSGLRGMDISISDDLRNMEAGTSLIGNLTLTVETNS